MSSVLAAACVAFVCISVCFIALLRVSRDLANERGPAGLKAFAEVIRAFAEMVRAFWGRKP
ncbi:hypothetical protein [Amycolatopsis sp. MtRt-6]|uniref:hypothetical protein n=1 Tax=Amycolatopsis sp. MtRt-6 TaxID=2792782 RepID=UPI001A8F6F79|nr:hypothetical protein [Amycolatopsis sp. MtRt-6]